MGINAEYMGTSTRLVATYTKTLTQTLARVIASVPSPSHCTHGGLWQASLGFNIMASTSRQKQIRPGSLYRVSSRTQHLRLIAGAFCILQHRAIILEPGSNILV